MEKGFSSAQFVSVANGTADDAMQTLEPIHIERVFWGPYVPLCNTNVSKEQISAKINYKEYHVS